MSDLRGIHEGADHDGSHGHARSLLRPRVIGGHGSAEGLQRQRGEGPEPAERGVPGLHAIQVAVAHAHERGAFVQPQGHERVHVEMEHGEQVNRLIG